MPKGISVVIPAYNEAIDIASCLEAFSNQTVAPKEIIVVDNNCTDDTVKIATEFPLVRIVKEKNKGITYARTAGFNAANYDIIARTDADTIVSPNWIETIEKHFNEDETLQGITGAVSARELSPGKTQWFKSLSAFTRWVAKKAIKYDRPYPLMVGHNMAVRRSAWQQVAGKVHLGDNDINEDVDASLFIQSVGKVAFFKDMIVKTRLIEMFFHPRKQLGYKRSIMHTLDLHK
ncbi:MAG: glycosyltransferase family 2 protein [Candidatus Microsaccharimonas sp.]